MGYQLTQALVGIGSSRDRAALRTALVGVYNKMSSQTLTTAGLVIKGATTKVAKTGAAVTYYMTNGRLGSIAAATDMPALAGTVTNAKFNVFAIFVDVAGTVSTAMGTEAATLGGVIFPAQPIKTAILGFIIINPTGTGNFVGGTTNLDDATVAPNAVYVSIVGGFDPTSLT